MENHENLVINDTDSVEEQENERESRLNKSMDSKTDFIGDASPNLNINAEVERRQSEPEVEPEEEPNHKLNQSMVYTALSSKSKQTRIEDIDEKMDKLNKKHTEDFTNEIYVKKRQENLIKVFKASTEGMVFANLAPSEKKYLEARNIKSTEDIFKNESKEKTFEVVRGKLTGAKMTKERVLAFAEEYKYAMEVIEIAEKGNVNTLYIEDLKKTMDEVSIIMENKGFSKDFIEDLVQEDTTINPNAKQELVDAKFETMEAAKTFDKIDAEQTFKETMDILAPGSPSSLSQEEREAFVYNLNASIPYYNYRGSRIYSNADENFNPTAHRDKILAAKQRAREILAGPKLTKESFDEVCHKLNQLCFVYDAAKKPTTESINAHSYIKKLTQAIVNKGVSRQLLSNAVVMYGTDKYDKIRDNILRIQEATSYTQKPLKANIDRFYDRLGDAFDADHNKTGTDLSKDNLLEAAKILREMAAYREQIKKIVEREKYEREKPEEKLPLKKGDKKNEYLRYEKYPLKDSSVDLKSIELHINNIQEFLEFKGVSKEQLNELISCSNKDLESSVAKVMEGKQKANVEKEIKSDFDKGPEKKQIEVEIHDDEIEDEDLVEFTKDLDKALKPRKKTQAPEEKNLTEQERLNKIKKDIQQYEKEFGKKLTQEDLATEQNIEANEINTNVNNPQANEANQEEIDFENALEAAEENLDNEIELDGEELKF